MSNKNKLYHRKNLLHNYKNAYSEECCCCYRSIFVIAIYDESDPNYIKFNTAGDLYYPDLNKWNDLIYGTWACSGNIVKLGLIIPNYFYTQFVSVKPPDAPWPVDIKLYGSSKTIDTINYNIVNNSDPRVFETDIINIFNSMMAEHNNQYPELLLFCLDNSGSILVSSYRDELDKAKNTLQNLYPNMKLLDDISNANERWIRDAYVGVYNRLCPPVCLCCNDDPTSFIVTHTDYDVPVSIARIKNCAYYSPPHNFYDSFSVNTNSHYDIECKISDFNDGPPYPIPPKDCSEIFAVDPADRWYESGSGYCLCENYAYYMWSTINNSTVVLSNDIHYYSNLGQYSCIYYNFHTFTETNSCGVEISRSITHVLRKIVTGITDQTYYLLEIYFFNLDTVSSIEDFANIVYGNYDYTYDKVSLVSGIISDNNCIDNEVELSYLEHIYGANILDLIFKDVTQMRVTVRGVE